ncbi:hypothetical protein ACEPAG_7477 [Sanghuangporus baumii]
MFGQFQLDNTASLSNERASSFTEPVAAHHTMSTLRSSHDVVDASDAFGAFGAFDASFDDDLELKLFEYLYDAGSHPSDKIDESGGDSIANNDNTTGRRDTPSRSTSRSLSQNVLPSSRLFNSPVESCYWANLGLASSTHVPSSETAVEDRDERASSSSSIAESDLFLVRSDLALSELQVAENPFSALLLPSMEDPQDDEKVVSHEELHLSPPPLAVSYCSDSTRADTPFPRTPSVEPCDASGAIPCHVKAAGSRAGAPVSLNGLPKVDSLLDKKTSSSECVSDAALSEVEEGLQEVSPSANAELVTSEPTPQPVDLELAPEVSFPSSTIGQGSHALTASQGTPPSRKRKRVAKSHAPHELRALSTLPPERKAFSLPIREGRASKSGINKVLNMELEAESCCHLAGNHGFCQFRDLIDGGRKCMAELPKDDKSTRAHLAMHLDALGWREYSKRHRNWKPTCPWCNEPRTKFEQLTRHILDTHLLMFMEWCPCGGTNSRSNHKPNTVRHEDTDVHKIYLQQQEVLRTVKLEDADDGQKEFVQRSSKGTKRRRRG